jgi:RNA polymerase sigma-70 factor (ECF subfamily)
VNGTVDLAAAVARFEGPLLQYVRHLIGSGAGDEVEDVVQDTFLRLHRQVNEKGRSIENVSSWLFRVAHNLAMDAGRRRSRRRKLQDKVMQDPVLNPATAAAAAADPAVSLARSEAQQLALAELQALPPEQKNVLLLKLIQGFTLHEISRTTGMKIGTVNYRLTQGLKQLSARLKERGAL